MLAGTVVSAVSGGLAGLMFAIGQDFGLVQALVAYQAGGLIAVLGFVTLAQPVSLDRY
jgi:hypothetical protein